MTITLTPEQTAQIQGLVDAGRFGSAEDALAYSIELVAHESTRLAQYSPKTLARLDEGMDEANRGEFVSQEEVEAFFTEWRNDPVK
jgi:Arc/MetJ-type ribon-helix-helix transcriptional regulator